MTQDERLDYLIARCRDESARYRDLQAPRDTAGKRRLLRSLMNVRPPRPMNPELLRVQDAYLSERIQENGVVSLSDIPTTEEQGSCHPEAARLSLWQGDITRLALDAIVNAANSEMLGCFVPCHTCIDNCIHTFAGVQLRAECDRQMKRLRAEYGPDYEQPTAVPMLTDGYNLPAKHVIHIVGPIVDGRLTAKHEKALTACYANTLDLCEKEGLHSVAFCCISTGVFRFPARRAAQIAVSAVTDWLAAHPDTPIRVVFNVFKDEDFEIYDRMLNR